MEPSSTTRPTLDEPTVRLYEKHSLLTRNLHSLNMVAIVALVLTGSVLLAGNRGLEPVARSIHEVFYFLLFAVAFAYIVSLIGGGWKMFVPTRDVLVDAGGVVKSELRLGPHTPRLAKYNGAQRLAYAAVLLMAAGEVITGLAMAYHEQIPWLGAVLGGRHAVHAIHKVLMFGIIAFVIVHVVEVIRAGWPSMRSMLSGYEIVPATTAPAVDGAFPEPERLYTPVERGAAHKTVEATTRTGFFSAAAVGATGLALVVVGALRGAGAKSRGAGPRGASEDANSDDD